MTYSDHFRKLRELVENRRDSQYARALAQACWRAALLFSAGICVALFAFGAYLFEGSVTESAQTSAATSTPAFDRALLQRSLGAYAARASQFQLLMASSSATLFADPSQ